MRPHGVSAAGQKKGIFGRVRAKAGQKHRGDELFDTLRSLNRFGIIAAGVSRTERCYEPSNAKSGAAIAGPGATMAIPPETTITTS
jgi:hypothetical protein